MRRSILTLAIMFGFLPVTTFAAPSIDRNIGDVVLVVCGDDDDPVHSLGSGVVVGNSTVLTNAHVVSKDGQPYEWCKGGNSVDAYEKPEFTYHLLPTPYSHNERSYDYAFMTAVDDARALHQFPSATILANADAMQIRDNVTLMGFPTSGGTTITVTDGAVVGYVDDVSLKADARADAGNSGGGAFDANGNLFGIVTRVTVGTYRTGYTIVQNINAIMEDAFGVDVAIRDLATLYTEENTFCLGGECYNIAANEQVWSSIGTDATPPPSDDDVIVYTIPEHVQYNAALHDAALQHRLLGAILLQVEQHGEAWYVDPETCHRVYMQDGDVAYATMRYLSLGMTDADLATLPYAETLITH